MEVRGADHAADEVLATTATPEPASGVHQVLFQAALAQAREQAAADAAQARRQEVIEELKTRMGDAEQAVWRQWHRPILPDASRFF